MKWEYKVVDIQDLCERRPSKHFNNELEDMLNELGLERWECISITNSTVHLKRVKAAEISEDANDILRKAHKKLKDSEAASAAADPFEDGW